MSSISQVSPIKLRQGLISFNCQILNSPILYLLTFNRSFLPPVGSYPGLRILFVGIIYLLSKLSLQAQNKIEFSDRTYESQIKTVQLYPNTAGLQDFLQSPAVPIQQQNLILEFDDLQENRNNYSVKLIHCNYDWTKSSLLDLEFLEGFNENVINDFAYSMNTHTNYVHYRYLVPPVKLPGNYLLLVYRDDPSQPILTKRLMIFNNLIKLKRDNQFIGSGNLNRGKQQFNFDLDYSDVEIRNPLETVQVAIRQNQRWDNMSMDIKPNFIRDNQSQLEYRFFDAEKQFDGGHEFRFVDFRSLVSPGQNTAKLNRTIKPYELYVATDAPRSYEAYSHYFDLNGAYLIANLDVGEASLTGNYTFVNFELKSSKLIDEEVYLVGAFNNYQRTEENKLIYVNGYYETRQFLKQGLYNYQYYADSKTTNPNTIEGNHFETENVYEVLIYDRPFRPNADLLLGYYLIQLNPR